MKRVLLTIVLFAGFLQIVNSQVRPEIAFNYLAEVCDTSSNYRDVIATNADEVSYPAVGNYKIEKSFYYSYSDYLGTNLQMIVLDSHISAMKFTKYFIYDEFQNLRYYVYQCEECGGIVVKYNGVKSEIIESSDDNTLAENYFLKSNTEFKPENILIEAKSNLKYCEFLWGLPNYINRTEFIRDRYKEVNEMSNLVERKSDNIIGYYNNDKLVKIVVKEESNHEYYLADGKLVFAFYPQTESEKAWRVYFAGREAYQVILGKKYLPKNADEFHDIEGTVIEDFDVIINNL